MLKERKTRASAVARRKSFLLNETIANQSAIARIREEGRRLQIKYGLRSEPVLSKSLELDVVWEREERVGTLLRKLEERST